jgi:hypothetical protein
MFATIPFRVPPPLPAAYIKPKKLKIVESLNYLLFYMNVELDLSREGKTGD